MIPSLRVNKTASLSKNVSIFCADLTVIAMALHYISDLPIAIFEVLFCVDSKSVLQSLQCSNSDRNIEEIVHLIHILIYKGT